MKQFVIISAALLAFSSAALAHHSAIQFDFGRTTPITGVVKKWQKVPNGHLLPYECAEEGWLKRLEELEQKTKPAK